MPATAAQREVYELQQQGLTRQEIADRTGRSDNAVKHMLARYRKWQKADSALADGANAIGADTPASLTWAKQQKDGTVLYSVMHSNKPEPPAPEEYAEAIRDALKSTAPPRKPKTAHAPTELLAAFPVADLHMGLLTDQEEVGEGWDTKKAQQVFQDTFGRLVEVTPVAGVALLGQLGDLTHTDDQRNVTPQNKHQLDVDSRFFAILRRAVAVMKWAIEALRAKYPKVIYRGTRGNHDITTHYAVTLALAEYYRNTSDVEIIESANEFYVHEFGANMVLIHHGDKAKPEKLVQFAAAEWPEIWGRTKHRIALSGHVHHETRKEVGGMVFESVGTIIPRDAYAYTHAFSGRRSLISIVLDHDAGEISRARIAA